MGDGSATDGPAVPILALDGVIVGMEPIDEPWPVKAGPLLWAVIGVFMLAPVVALVALPESLVWAVIVRFILARPSVPTGRGES